jgi:hypothetical protein
VAALESLRCALDDAAAFAGGVCITSFDFISVSVMEDDPLSSTPPAAAALAAASAASSARRAADRGRPRRLLGVEEAEVEGVDDMAQERAEDLQRLADAAQEE